MIVVREPARSRRLRLRVVAVLFLLLAPLAVGCVRVHTSITVSPDDQVSGEIIAAAKPRNNEDQGPQFEMNMGFSQKIDVEPYDADGYVGSQATFSNLTFAEVPQLANLSRDATGVDVSLRRAGNLVILEGRVDLTTLTDPDADVKFSAAFPGEVTSTNGERLDANAVQWTLKPGVVNSMSAQSRFTDPSTRSFTAAAIGLGVAALLVSGLIGYLAWRDRDQSVRLGAAGSGEQL